MSAGRIPGISFHHPVRQPAWLRASPSVAAAPAVPAAQKTLSGITITEGAVNKNFYIKTSFFFHTANLGKGQFPRRHYPVHAKPRGGSCPIHIRYGHLCASVNLHAGEILADKGSRSHILHDHAVQTFLIKRLKEIIQSLRDFLLFHEGIYSQI